MYQIEDICSITLNILVHFQKQFRLLTMILLALVAKVTSESKLQVCFLIACENYTTVHGHADFVQGPSHM